MSTVAERQDIAETAAEPEAVAYRPRDPGSRAHPPGPWVKFLLVDSAVIVVAIALAFVTWFSRHPVDPALTGLARYFPLGNLTIYAYAILPVLALRLFLHFAYGLYDFVHTNTRIDIAYNAFQAIALGAIIELFVFFYVDKYALGATVQISRPLVLLTSAYLYLGAVAWRFAYFQRRKRWAYDSTRLLIIGAGDIGLGVLREIQRYSRLGHEVVGMIDDEVGEYDAPVRILGRLEDLGRIVREHRIDEVIVAAENSSRSQLVDILYACEQTDVRIRVLPDLYDVLIGKVQIQQVGGVPLIEVRNGAVPSYVAMRKRIFDLVFAFLFLIPFLLTLPFIALGIWLTDRGPVFYVQERVGRHRRRFRMIKFRTMVPGAESMTGPVLATDRDERITPIGCLLRRYYIDEIPQILNVLKGDMSIVGPRPERPMFVKTFIEEDRSYRMRLSVRPGITGLAQIHGYYGSSVPNKLRYDIAYINAQSIRLDFKILLLTFMVALSGKRV